MYALNCQFFIALTKKTFYTSSFSGLPFNHESLDLATAYRGGPWSLSLHLQHLLVSMSYLFIYKLLAVAYEYN